MFYGDESYGRNDGYFALLESCRDVFERDEPKFAFKELNNPNFNFKIVTEEIVLGKDEENSGGFFNGGLA
jgi:tryptophanase